MRLLYSPEAREDLRTLVSYITEEFCDPSAAFRARANILRACSYLKTQPYMGFSLALKTGAKTDLRGLVCGYRIVFYRVEPQSVRIVRILDSRTDYMKILF